MRSASGTGGSSNPEPGTIEALAAQAGKLANATPSLVVFIAMNYAMTKLFKHYGLASVPPPLVGMFLLFGVLLSLPEATAGQVVNFFKPGTDLITRFLPMFFVPALIVLPLSASTLAGVDAAKCLAVILLGLLGCYTSTAMVVEFLQKVAPPQTTVADSSGSLPGFSQFLEGMFAAFVVISGAAAVKAPQVAPAFMLCTTIFSFVFGSRLPRLLPTWVGTIWHPLMTCFVMATASFSVYAAAAGTTLSAVLKSYLIPGGAIMSAPGNAIMYWLGPAIWSFAFGLYGRRKILFANLIPIIGGTAWAAVSGIFGMAALNRFIAPSAALKLATLPRATAALAVVQAGMIGASTSLVTAVCVLTGMLGANFGKVILNAIGCKSPCARGVATGGSSFSLGAAALAKDDPGAFPFGALAMALMSTWATLLYAVPLVSETAVKVADVGKPAVVAKNQKKAPQGKTVKGKKVAFLLPQNKIAQ